MLTCHPIPFAEECVQIFCPLLLSFLIGLLVVFLLNCESSLQIQVLCQIYVLQIFSPSLGLVFTFLNAFWWEKDCIFLNFVYLFMAAAGLRCCVFSPVVASSGSFLLRWVGLSLQRLLLSWSAGSPGPGIGPVSLRFTSGFFTTELQGKPKSL